MPTDVCTLPIHSFIKLFTNVASSASGLFFGHLPVPFPSLCRLASASTIYFYIATGADGQLQPIYIHTLHPSLALPAAARVSNGKLLEEATQLRSIISSTGTFSNSEIVFCERAYFISRLLYRLAPLWRMKARILHKKTCFSLFH